MRSKVPKKKKGLGKWLRKTLATSRQIPSQQRETLTQRLQKAHGQYFHKWHWWEHFMPQKLRLFFTRFFSRLLWALCTDSFAGRFADRFNPPLYKCRLVL